MAHILLVEDNPGDVDLLRECFREIGAPHTFELAGDGQEALKILMAPDRPKPDIILLDLNLPIKTGHEVLEAVKRSPDLHRIPVVVLTSSSARQDVARAYENYANAYVQKPQNYDELVTLVSRFEQFWMHSVKLPTTSE